MFELIDHNGNVIQCPASAWTNKILANHPELEDREEDVRRAVSDPDQVLQDRDYPDRRHFIRGLHRTRFFIDVIVEYAYAEGTVTGRIVTAFMRERVRHGDTVLYVRKKTMKSTNANTLPAINLESLERLVVAYDSDDDIAYLHIGGPRKAITVQADDSWYLRVADGEVVGLELHGLRRVFLTTPLFSAVFKPAIEEMEALSGASFFGDEGFRVEGHATDLPRTFRLLILLIGQGLARYQVALQEELDGRRSLVPAS